MTRIVDILFWDARERLVVLPVRTDCVLRNPLDVLGGHFSNSELDRVVASRQWYRP